MTRAIHSLNHDPGIELGRPNGGWGGDIEGKDIITQRTPSPATLRATRYFALSCGVHIDGSPVEASAPFFPIASTVAFIHVSARRRR